MDSSDEQDDFKPVGATCAGKPIAGAMYPFSGDLMYGSERFAGMAEKATEGIDVRSLNAASITFGVSAIDAKVNEWIAISREIEDGPQPVAFWNELADLQRTIRLERKWNLIASVNGGTLWDGGKEPFQSYETAVAVRNEIVHFKGEFLGRDEAPNKRIQGLMQQLGVKSTATFVEGDVSSWVYDLLGCPKLGHWVARRIRPFFNDVHTLLLRSPNHRMEPTR